ncbi:cell division ATP-binding protein FtsE [Candidatus Beckwithbacteria bacterium CG23_combo_of_CG06-09_8_20_14_all_34_8]|uniref:Cell division ATP-binding protein FtsE n=1 Tax=Candidatus Beckwithbacteria bacterium CG23_combo_of_CG06-09_8_20_14_all_34_8 TaxID=1974497 RepID=A0A2H0B5N8_9BACT|nr:MAG: cell division ATP-binding protein FtsE [Candidatus Beckwithbacteria bacterium CG23_combo_of_CG06-09_8_20_14_all_34_8]
MSLINFDGVTYKFNTGVEAIKQVSFSIDEGEFVFLVGPSGAGKTTLMRLMLRELLPTEGKIILDNEEISRKRGISVSKLRQKIGASFQDVKLLLDRTVAENIALAMEIAGKKNSEIKEAVTAVLDLVGLGDKGDVFPVQLSGGERQRAGIARAVVGDPIVIFADEPTANLDEETAWKIAALLKEINRSGKAVIVATHNADLVDSMGARVIYLDQGGIIEDKKKGTYHRKK